MIASIEVLLSKASLVEVEILVEKVFKTRKSKYSYKLSFFVFISVSIFFFLKIPVIVYGCSQF